MNKAGICRELAEKLGWSYAQGLRDDDVFNPFDSEDDSARLLEVMPYGRISWDRKSLQWTAESDWRFFHNMAEHPDRCTAIVLAACKWKSVEVG